MYSNVIRCLKVCLSLVVAWTLFCPGSLRAALTVEVGTPPLPPDPLVNHSDTWRFRRGTNEPPADWHTVEDGELDGSWESGPGGFGFGDGDDATQLLDMRNQYLSVYTRQSFEITSAVDPNRVLRLSVDWDDGFVAYLDGVQFARSPNVPGNLGDPHPFDLGVFPDHPANVEGGAVGIFDINPVADRLGVGTHVLAVQGINGDVGSSDVTLIADLALVDLTGGVSLASGFFSLVRNDTVHLSGTSTDQGTRRVIVNGVDAAYNITDGAWSRDHLLAPGMNRFFIAALDGAGSILTSTNVDIVYEAATTSVGGTISGDLTWESAQGTVRVTSPLTIDSGATLTVGEGVIVLLSPGSSIVVSDGSHLEATGTEDQPVFFLPADGSSPWGQLLAIGADTTMDLQQAEVVAGQLRIATNAVMTVEDSVLRDMHVRQMVEGSRGSQLTLRRTHLNRYAQTHIDFTPTLIEDCLIENVTSDATDFEGSNFDAVIRRTTYRHGVGGNTDAFDTDNSVGILLENCLIHDFPDKAVSIADLSHDTVIRNNLIYNSGSGLSCYASSNCVFNQNTVINCDWGLRLYIRPDHPSPGNELAGDGTATNNVLWANTNSLSVTDGATLEISFSDISGEGIAAGMNNINEDPLFLDETGKDFHLGEGSPASGTGLDGLDMGVLFPVGGIPATPSNLAATSVNSNTVQLRWEEDADNEEGFLITRSLDANSWEVVGSAGANATSYADGELEALQAYYYRVRATNSSGGSRLSNLAIGVPGVGPVLETMVGGELSASTTWTTNLGTVLVLSDLTVPAGVTLTIAAGVNVKMTNGASIRAVDGGSITINGSAEQKVVIERLVEGDNWIELSATGGGELTIRHADISGGAVRFLTDVVGLMEDSNVHHFSPGGSAIVNSVRAASVTVRRCHISFYHETNFTFGLTVIEDCLFEFAVNASSDALDFDSTPPGSVIRRCTFRNGLQTNTDAIDVGPRNGVSTVGLLVEDCLMYDFTDKGISVGDFTVAQGATLDLVVRNCLIYNTTVGIQVKGESWATVYNCTIVDSEIGLHGFEKNANTGGGIFTNTYNNILSRNTAAIETESDTFIVVNFSDTQGTNWPGTDNLDLDPLFVDPLNHDYRLQPNSPCLGTGSNGVNMGVTFPVGGLPATPVNLVIQSLEANQVTLSWGDPSDNESGFVLEHSSDGSDWCACTTAPADAVSGVITEAFDPELVHRFRVRATNFIGGSFYSNVATTSQDPDDIDGDGMPNTWETAHHLNPNDASDANQDGDGDGATNLEEYLSGTDPEDAESVLKIQRIELVGLNQVELEFTAVADQSYSVEYRESAESGPWLNVTDVSPEAFSRPFTVTDFLFPGTKTRYYRVVSTTHQN